MDLKQSDNKATGYLLSKGNAVSMPLNIITYNGQQYVGMKGTNSDGTTAYTNSYHRVLCSNADDVFVINGTEGVTENGTLTLDTTFDIVSSSA